MLTTCTSLTANFYPMDSVNWFQKEKHSQVVFFAHLLFPVKPEKDRLESPKKTSSWVIPLSAWHPPLLYPANDNKNVFNDSFYAEAKWIGPDNAIVAHYGLTMSARAEKDYQLLGSDEYVPHTFAMAIGMQELRSQAGQVSVPVQAGQYRIEFTVDGKKEALTFFRILGNAAQPSAVENALPGGVSPGVKTK